MFFVASLADSAFEPAPHYLGDWSGQVARTYEGLVQPYGCYIWDLDCWYEIACGFCSNRFPVLGIFLF